MSARGEIGVRGRVAKAVQQADRPIPTGALERAAVVRSGVPPSTRITLRAILWMGSQLKETRAGLVDNPIDADPRRVLVRVLRDDDRLQALVPTDDRQRVDEAELEKALCARIAPLGAAVPPTDRPSASSQSLPTPGPRWHVDRCPPS